MIKRYERPEISAIWTNENKLQKWQEVELAVVRAREDLGIFPAGAREELGGVLSLNPIDIEWWLARDKQIHHDLNAFLEERLRFLPAHLRGYFHKHMTSYDTEEAPLSMMMKESLAVVARFWDKLVVALKAQAYNYRYTLMYARTHGQGAKMQTFGKRILTWLQDLAQANEQLKQAAVVLKYSRLSGAVGNYGELSPAEEREALRILGFEPYLGATQIMPRVLYAPLAQALANFVLQLEKVALDFRLGARSGRPLYQEPFAAIQKGSSAMPHKKNTIITEQVEGMGRLALGYLVALTQNITTWEERAIEQSCVERVAFPDLFHVLVHVMAQMTNVVSGMRVYPDNMLLELVESGGCYASDEAKEVLKGILVPMGVDADECYRIVQLAAFNVFRPDEGFLRIRVFPSQSLETAEDTFNWVATKEVKRLESIEDLIPEGRLSAVPDLQADAETVERWNYALKEAFVSAANRTLWHQTFKPSRLLRHEVELFERIL